MQNNKYSYGVLKYSSTNIGDEIQSIAAMRFLPDIDEYVHREHICDFKPIHGRKTKLIMNAWWMWKPAKFPPPETIEPLLISMFVRNLARREFLSEKTKQYLIKHGPVGCRDLGTLEWLKANNIPAYFSGCLTLTLQRNNDIPRQNYILCVDLDEDIVNEIKKRTKKPVYSISRKISSFYNSKERLEVAKLILRLYHDAHCVVSHRLHVVLPSLAFETPVLWLKAGKREMGDATRYLGYEEFLNSATTDEFMNNPDIYNFDNPPPNPEKHLEIREKLIKTCSEFTGYDSKQSCIKSDENPLIKMFQLNRYKYSNIKRILYWAHYPDIIRTILNRLKGKNKHDIEDTITKRIVLVGLENTNLGNKVIMETCKKLVQAITPDSHITTMNLFPDKEITDEFYKIHYNINKPFKKGTKLVYLRQINRFRKWKKFTQKGTPAYNYYKKHLENADIVIFAGGGIIKTSRENFWNGIYSIVNFCDKNKIPVFFNSVGIEGYDNKSFYTHLLKYSLNRKCVKGITTRDDVASLNKYVKSKAKIKLTGDAALWTSNFYPSKYSKNSEIIGIGLIRGKIFTDYGVDFKEEDILKTYINIIKSLEKKGYKWQLFSNGNKSDYEMGIKILEVLNLPVSETLLVKRPEKFEELLTTISSYKAVIAGRLHANIIAASYNIPSVGLIWNDKLKFFGQTIGFQNRFIEKEKFFQSDYIIEQLEEAMSNKYDYNKIYTCKYNTKRTLEYAIKKQSKNFYRKCIEVN